MSTEKKFQYKDRKIQGTFPGKVLNARLVEQYKRKKVELVIVIDRNGQKEEVLYHGDLEGEYAPNAVESVIKAGFIGDGWNSLQSGINSTNFQVIPFNVVLVETDKMDGERVVDTRTSVRFIVSPDEQIGAKKLEGTVNGMEGSFAAARAKMQKPTAQQSTNKDW